MDKEIMELIEQGKLTQARNEIIKMNVVDIAHALEELEGDKLVIVFRLLPKEIAADVFSYMSTEQKQQIISAITDREIKNIIDQLFFDDAIDLLEEMP